MRIGIDIMGGDFSPGAAIEGSLLARKELPSDVEIILIGDRECIEKHAAENACDLSVFEIIHTSDWLRMGDHPLKALKKTPGASIFLGQRLLKNKKIDGFCSAGNTGAMLVGAMQIVTPIPGVIRPAISAMIPNFEGPDSVLLDVGLNPDARPDVLYQYGILGSLYARLVNEIPNPRVALLNIGEEEEKGNLVTRSTWQLMDDSSDFNFIGNMEANALFLRAETDVLVCDGFVGNIVLKEAEAFYRLISSRKVCNGYFEMFNFENFGGTPVLGVKAPLVIGHGISNNKAVKNMIIQTRNVVESGLVNNITETLNN
ncbi:MAG: phosphate acyltransferase PlsX [Bacteroidales bacterium]|nr:phosphate acyltransferase PlsX [Bacteroidales bacterium]MDT8430356.1 phosphate acyltransferase PlsX [Bacteroidales bacterium]